MQFLSLTFQFLSETGPTRIACFHGQGDGGPEWPPTPLRAFQALVASASNRWKHNHFQDYAVLAMEWLEKQKCVLIVAPAVDFGTPFRTAVPNNDLDAWAHGISRGNQAKKEPNELKTMKDVRPTHLQGDAVYYLFELSDGVCPHFDVLVAAARSITHLGWGVDMVAGNAELLTEEQVAKLPGERWVPSQSGTPLRVPKDGTLADLMRKHTDFLGRLSNGGFKPVPPLREFDTVCYRRSTDPAPRKWVAFSILKPDASGNASFGTTRRCRDVAAWVRNATSQVCQEWKDAGSFVHGHAADGSQTRGEQADERFMYLPLPTINSALGRVESIRRVMIAAPSQFADRLEWIRRRLPGQDLVEENEKQTVGLLNLLPTSDWVLRQYTGESTTWSTVTPVVLPGYDDPGHLRRRLRENRDADTQHRLLDQLHQRTEGLLQKALGHAGLSAELVSGAELEWREVGFRAGTDLASRYVRPERLGRFAAVHVRVRFANAIPGPLAIGAGRYRGLGLFANESR